MPDNRPPPNPHPPAPHPGQPAQQALTLRGNYGLGMPQERRAPEPEDDDSGQ